MQIQNTRHIGPATVKTQTSKPAPKTQGALIIIDAFHPSTEHGKRVEQTALDMGPTGEVHRYNHLETTEDGKPKAPIQDATHALTDAFTDRILHPQEAAEHLDTFLNDAATGLLDKATKLLKDVTADGFQDSVVNLSQGVSAVEYFGATKQPLAGNFLSPEKKQLYINNLIRAAAPTAQEFPTMAEFDNLLMGTVKTALTESPAIQESKTRWSEQVSAFEAGNNSVVLAAGNSGGTLAQLSEQGLITDGSEDKNILATEETTVVGATATTEDGGIFLAGPSSYGPEIDFIASGFHGQHFGTSFAAPKVSTAMLAIHVSNPGSNSESVEQSTKEILGQPVTLREHNVTILNEPLTSQALKQIEEDSKA